MQSVRQLMRRKAYRTFFVSFVGAFLLPTLVLAGVMVRLSAGMEQEAEMGSRLVLEQFKGGVDGQLYTVMRMADNIAMDDKSLYFAERDDPMRYLNNISAFQMLKAMTQEVGVLTAVSTDIELCYVYLPRSGKVISNTITEAADFFHRKLAGEFAGPEAWLAFLEGRPDGFWRLGRVQYLRSIRRGERWLMAVVVTINDTPFEDYRALFQDQSHIQAAVFSREGEALFHTGGGMPALPEAIRGRPEGSALTQWDGGAARIHWTASAETGCVYLTITPEAVFTQGVRALRLGSVLGGAALLALGLALSLGLARRQYRPILALRGFIENNAEAAEPGKSDDFGYLSEMLRAISDEHRTGARRVQDTSRQMELFALERLLKGMYVSEEEMENQLLGLNIVMDAPAFFVVCFSVDDFAGGGAQLRQTDWELIRFVVSNVFEELLAEFSPHTVVCDGCVWAVCGAPEGEGAWREALESVLRSGRGFLRDRFDFSLSIAASDSAAGLDGVQRAYRTALRLLRQAEGEPDSLLMAWQAEKPEAGGTEKAPVADAQRLARMILDGDEEGIRGLLGEWKAQAAAAPYFLAHLRWNALVQEMLPLLSGYGEAARGALTERIRAFVEGPPLQDDFQAVLSLCLFACRLPWPRGDGGRGAEVAGRVRAYIEENYRSSELNITQIADFLGLTPGYASALYKRQAGESMLDSINRVRLGHAKRLLLETETGLEEVAEQVGYYNGSTFLRAFKKHEGITPGRYRAMRAAKSRGV